MAISLPIAIEARSAVAGSKKVDTAMKRVEKGANRAGKAVGRMQKKTNSLGNALKVVRGAVIGFFAAFAGISAVSAATSIIAGFGETMAEIAGVAQATVEEFRSFIEITRELGAITRFTAQEAGEGLLFLSRAGFSAIEAVQALPDTLDLATAGMLDLGTAADTASNILKQFELDASETNRVVDTLVNVANSANTNVLQLAEAMKFVGPVANALGISVEKTASLIGVLGDAGIQASMAGTNLRGAFLALLNPTRKAKNALADVGLTSQQVNPEINDISVVLERLRDANLSAAGAGKIFGRRNVSAAIILAKSVERVDELTEATEKNTGVARRNARLIENTLAGAFRSLKSAAQELILGLGDRGLSRAFKDMIIIATGAVRILAGLEDKVTENRPAAKLLADAIKLVTLALTAMVAVRVIKFLSTLTIGLRAAGAAALGLSGSFNIAKLGLVGPLIAGIGVAAVTTGRSMGDLADAFKRFLELTGILEEEDPRVLSGAGLKAAAEAKAVIVEFDKLRKAGKDTSEVIRKAIEGGIIPTIQNQLKVAIAEAAAEIENLKEATIISPAKIGVAETELNIRKDIENLFNRYLKEVQKNIKRVEDSTKAPDIFKPKEIDSLLFLIEGKIKKRFENLRKIIADPFSEIDEINKAIRKVATAIKFASDNEAVSIDVAERLRENLRDLAGDYDGVRAARTQASEDEKEFFQAIEAGRKASIKRFDQLQSEAEEAAKALDEVREAEEKRIGGINDSIQEMFSSLEFERSLIDKTNDERERAERLASLESLARAALRDDVQELITTYKQELIELQKFKELVEIANEVGDAFADAFERAIFGAEDFRAVFLDLIRELSATAFRESVSEPLSKSIGKLFTNIASSLIGGGGGPLSGSGLTDVGREGIPSAFTGGGVTGSLIPAAHGGIFTRPTAVLAGEAGPEMITPLNRLPGLLRAGGQDDQPPAQINVPITVVTQDADSFRRSRTQVQNVVRQAVRIAQLGGGK
ncbi:MAG: phage tail tape measure protein [Planctomycetes bacterium]|nr:phage tail tape measure protein [Planctomycetota bacterium]